MRKIFLLFEVMVLASPITVVVMFPSIILLLLEMPLVIWKVLTKYAEFEKEPMLMVAAYFLAVVALIQFWKMAAYTIKNRVYKCKRSLLYGLISGTFASIAFYA
jgi:hypothetical protein